MERYLVPSECHGLSCDDMWRHTMTLWHHVTSHNELCGKRIRKCPTWEVRDRSGVFIFEILLVKANIKINIKGLIFTKMLKLYMKITHNSESIAASNLKLGHNIVHFYIEVLCEGQCFFPVIDQNPDKTDDIEIWPFFPTIVFANVIRNWPRMDLFWHLRVHVLKRIIGLLILGTHIGSLKGS